MSPRRGSGKHQIKLIKIFKANKGIWLSSRVLIVMSQLTEKQFHDSIRLLRDHRIVIWIDRWPGEKNKTLKYWRLKDEN